MGVCVLLPVALPLLVLLLLPLLLDVRELVAVLLGVAAPEGLEDVEAPFERLAV